MICVIVGLSRKGRVSNKLLFTDDFTKEAKHINAYLLDGEEAVVESRPEPLSPSLPKMLTGSVPNDDGNLILSMHVVQVLRSEEEQGFTQHHHSKP